MDNTKITKDKIKENTFSMDRMDIKILSVLYEKDMVSPIAALGIKSIMEQTNIEKEIPYVTICKHIRTLCENDYLLLGYKDKRAKTYYLTEKSINFLKDIEEKQNFIIKDNEEEI